MKKTIGIDCRMWSETGIGRYIQNIVYQLDKQDNNYNYVLFVLSKDLPKIYDFNLNDNFSYKVCDIRWYTFKEQILMPVYFYRAKLALVFCPNLNVPVFYLKPFVVTIHDLTVLRIKTGRVTTLPPIFYKIKRIAVSLVLRYALFFSKKIFVVSNFVKNDVMQTFKINENKIKITSCAVSSKFKPINENKQQAILSQYNIKKPFLFYLGNAHPHKNLERLISAFGLVLEQNSTLTLVLGGKKDYFYKRLEEETRSKPFFDKTVFTDFIKDAHLPAIYSASELFVNPSLHEGFGIQTLEAFACGTKVACSNSTSLPEIGGNISFYFNPKDPKDMASTILRALNDTSMKRVEEGHKRVNNYSWESSAKQILDTFESILR